MNEVKGSELIILQLKKKKENELFGAAGHSCKIFSAKFKECYVHENSPQTVN